MVTKRAHPLKSEGARLERRAMRARLRRRERALVYALERGHPTAEALLTFARAELAWVQGRQKRFDKRAGGLGR